jgi:hypothetical protein
MAERHWFEPVLIPLASLAVFPFSDGFREGTSATKKTKPAAASA